MLILPEGYDNIPLFSMREMNLTIDRFESVLEALASAREPGTEWTQAKISVQDILDVMHHIVYPMVDRAGNLKISAIWDLELADIFAEDRFRDDEESMAQLKKRGLDEPVNPYAAEIGKIQSAERTLKMFDHAIKYDKIHDEEMEAEYLTANPCVPYK